MQGDTGRIVQSLAGHDAGVFYVVVAEEKGRVLLADGGRYGLERPKRKNPKHIRKTNTRLEASSFTTNQQLRKALCAVRNNEGGNQIV